MILLVNTPRQVACILPALNYTAAALHVLHLASRIAQKDTPGGSSQKATCVGSVCLRTRSVCKDDWSRMESMSYVYPRPKN